MPSKCNFGGQYELAGQYEHAVNLWTKYYCPLHKKSMRVYVLFAGQWKRAEVHEYTQNHTRVMTYKCICACWIMT